MKKESAGPLIGGFFIGGVVTLIAVFASGWAVTSTSAREMGQEMAEQAVVDRLADIAMVEVRQDPAFQEKLQEMKELQAWEQEDFVAEQGWATLPGKEEPNMEVAEELAERLTDQQG
jgi:hypothetical protein